MTDRISIPALCERVDTAGEIPDVFVALSEDEYLALVEAVEAAAGLYGGESESAWERLHDALARFDFGEET